MKQHRKLTDKERKQLQAQACRADNWDEVLVSADFIPDHIIGCHFSGTNYLGRCDESIPFPGGVSKTAGIYHSHLHNCQLGNQVYISQVKNYMANYHVEDHVVIENADLIMVDGPTSFGNGTLVDVLDETGGRKLMICDRLSAHLAYIMVFYRHLDHLPQSIENMIRDHTSHIRSDRGRIGAHSRLMNCGQIINVRIGDHASIHGASRLMEGSINSNAADPVEIGDNVVADHFIISSGSVVSNHAVLSHCFVGQGCELSKHYSAIHSVFFSNCQGFNGEACSIFAGPFTVTHHKSTLLIAGMFSFTNAGSGSNQSNHMYKLGPIHHGIVERGSKTTSDSYLLWPAKIGPFTLVMGRHYKNPDTSLMPFSYLIENNDETWLAPAVNLRSVGTIRDAMKWPRRDKRKDPDPLDCLNYNLLSPYTIQRMISGRAILENLKKISGEITDTYTWETTFISKSSLLRGIQLYSMGIIKFLGNSVISRIEKHMPGTARELRQCLTPSTKKGAGPWIDLSGLIAPKEEIEALIRQLEQGQVHDLSQMAAFFRELHENYYEYEWTWAAALLEDYLHKPLKQVTPADVIQLVEQWKESVVGLDKMLYEDARKEFRLSAMTGFGLDGDSDTKQQDFKKVRGTFQKNRFVNEILEHIRKKTELGDRTIQQLQNMSAHSPNK